MACKICRKYDLPFHVFLMVGLPTQNEDDYKKTYDFILETNPDHVHVSHFIPYPGSYLFDYYIENDHMPKNWSLDNYLGIDSSIIGVKNIIPSLRNIDHEMAEFYKKKYEDIIYRKRKTIVLNRLKQANDFPWILVGTGQYFYEIVKMTEENKFEMYNGYIDSDSKSLIHNYNPIQKSSYKMEDQNNIIKNAVVTSHLSGNYFQELIKPFIEKNFKSIKKIVSASTFDLNENCILNI